MKYMLDTSSPIENSNRVSLSFHLIKTLRLMSKDGDFKSATAAQHADQYVHGAFISGLLSSYIRQRLLKNSSLLP